jgi:hypothetical protein
MLKLILAVGGNGDNRKVGGRQRMKDEGGRMKEPGIKHTV